MGFRSAAMVAVAAMLLLPTHPATAAGAANGHTVLILATSVTGGENSREAQEANLAGMDVEMASDAQWRAKSTLEFASYRALILGDPSCVFSSHPITAAEETIANWGPAINGNVIIIGTAPAYHVPFHSGALTLLNNAIDFVVASPVARTGMYISLSCYYAEDAIGASVPVLDAFGAFTVSPTTCWDQSHITSQHVAFTGLGDADLSGWECSASEVFQTWAGDFDVLAIADGFGSSYTAEDGSVGSPYILARGAFPTSPTISVSLDPTTLVAANHDMVPITATVTTTGSGVTLTRAISSDETVSGQWATQWEDGADITHFNLRADCLASGDGRVYTVTYTATDEFGVAGTASATVTVPNPTSPAFASRSIPGVDVAVKHGSASPSVATTDARGSARFIDLPEGSYDLTVSQASLDLALTAFNQSAGLAGTNAIDASDVVFTIKGADGRTTKYAGPDVVEGIRFTKSGSGDVVVAAEAVNYNSGKSNTPGLRAISEDFALSMSAVTSGVPGSAGSYFFRATNHGDDTAGNVEVRVEIPAGIAVESISPPDATLLAARGTGVIVIRDPEKGELAPGETFAFELRFTVTDDAPSGRLISCATFSADSISGLATCASFVVGRETSSDENEPPIAFSMAASDVVESFGSLFIRAENRSDDTVKNFAVIDSVPQGLIVRAVVITDSTVAAAFDTGVIVARDPEKGELAPGEVLSIEIRFMIADGAPAGRITNCATFSADDVDTVEACADVNASQSHRRRVRIR
jgi:hypothetical protein